MGRSVNLIDQDSATFFRGKGAWNVANGTVFLDRNEIVVPNYASLRVTPIDEEEPVIFTYENVFIDKAYKEDSVQFHCRVKTLVGSVTRISLIDPNSVLSRYSTYAVKTTSLTGDPSNGFVTYNSNNQTASTKLQISYFDSNGINLDYFLKSMQLDDTLEIRDSSNPANFQKFAINGTIRNRYETITQTSPNGPISVKNDKWVDVPVVLVESGGTGTTGFSDAMACQIIYTRPTPVADNGTGFNSWGICRSEKMLVPDLGQGIFVNIQVEVYNHLGNDVYFTAPFIFISNNIFRDPYIIETFINLPSVIREAEINHESDHGLPDFPLSRFIELPGNFAGDVASDYYAYEYLTAEDGQNINDPNTLSQFVEPLVAKSKFIPWLSQMVGVYLDNPTTGKTPWENIPTQWQGIEQSIDTTANPLYAPTILSRSSNVVTATIGSHSIVTGKWITLSGSTAAGTSFNGSFEVTSTTGTTISWSQTGGNESAILLGSIILLDTEWTELENFNPTLDGLIDYLRWQVKYAYNGLNAGTYAAVVNAVKRVLTGDKKVSVEYAAEGDPWQVLIRTRTSETPDGEDGIQSFLVSENIRKVKPAGYKIVHECTVTGE